MLILDTALCICATGVLFPNPLITAGGIHYIWLFGVARGTIAGSSVTGGGVAGSGEKDLSNIFVEFLSVSENKTKILKS